MWAWFVIKARALIWLLEMTIFISAEVIGPSRFPSP
jgi:hypothetical protein